MKSANILLLFILVFYSCGNSQEKKDNNKYSVDEKTNSEIDNKLSKFNKHFNCLIQTNRFENDILIAENIENPGLSFTRFEDKTATVTGFVGNDDGYGFVLLISKDTCIAKLEVESTNEIFKLSKNDKPIFGLMIPCVNKKITLTKEPNCENGEIISGKLAIESENYYELINGNYKKIRVEMKAYFNSEPMPIENKKYKTLVKN